MNTGTAHHQERHRHNNNKKEYVFPVMTEYETDTSPQSIVEDLTVKNVRWDRHVFKTVTVSQTLVFLESVCLVTT